MTWRNASDERSTATIGCLLSLGSALVTCLLLFLNGSLVMALVQPSQPWNTQPGVTQFLLLFLPVLMTLAQWWMIDYVRTRVIQRPKG